MPRPEKVQAVAEIKERLSDAEAVFVAEYAGLSVAEQQQLRRGLKAAGGEFRVVKMTLARRAASELGHDDLVDMLIGPTGLAFASGDAAAAAKALRDFSKDHTRLVIKGALLGADVLPPERVSELADLEPREVLLAKIAGAFQAPMAAMAGLLAAMPRAMATMIQQLIDRGEEAEPEPEVTEAPAVSEEAPAESDDVPAEPDEVPAADEPAAQADEAAAEPDEATAEPEDEPAAEPDDDPAADEPPAEPDETPAADDPPAESDESTADTDDPSDDDAADPAEEE